MREVKAHAALSGESDRGDGELARKDSEKTVSRDRSVLPDGIGSAPGPGVVGKVGRGHRLPGCHGSRATDRPTVRRGRPKVLPRESAASSPSGGPRTDATQVRLPPAPQVRWCRLVLLVSHPCPLPCRLPGSVWRLSMIESLRRIVCGEHGRSVLAR